MLRVLNVMEDGRIAGPQLRMIRVARTLSGRVETIVAIPTSPPFEFRDRMISEGVSYVQLPLSKLSRQPLEILKSVAMLPLELYALKRYIDANDIDIVHSRVGAWMFKAIIAARLSNIPAVWHLNDTSSPAPFRILARLLLKRSVAGVIVAGSRVKTHYLSDYEERYKNRLKLISIDAPVDTKKFTPARSSRISETLRIITVGNINPVKDYLTVVRCASKIEKKIDVHWTIVGSTYKSQEAYFRRVKNLCRELMVKSIEFVGAKENIHEHLSNSDVYVCASVAEASPTSVWEAMACGLPIISTDVGCVKDHIQHGRNGYIVNPGDFEEMSKSIFELCSSEYLRTAMGKLNREVAVQKFDISVCADKHLQIYNAIL